MTTPQFIELDDTAFDDSGDFGVSLNTANLKKTAEDCWYCINERLPPVGRVWASWSGGSLVRQPTFASVRWGCYCLGSHFVPAILQTHGIRQVRIRLRANVARQQARFFVWSDDATPDLTVADLDAGTNEANATAYSGLLDVDASDYDLSLDVRVVPGQWNTFWVAIRTERDPSSKSNVSEIATWQYNRGFPRLSSDGTFTEFLPNDVPPYYVFFGNEDVTDEDLAMMSYRAFYTVGYVDTSSPDDTVIYPSELTGFEARDLDTTNLSEQYRTYWAELGTLTLKGFFIDATQANELELVPLADFPELRAWQPPGATRMRRIFNLTDGLYTSTMLPAGIGQDAIDLVNQDFPGVWQLSGSGRPFGNTGTVDSSFLATQTEVWRTFLVWDATFRDGSVPGLEVAFLWAASVATFDREITIEAELEILDMAGTSVATGTAEFSFTHAAPVTEQDPFDVSSTSLRSGGVLGYNFRATKAQRDDLYLAEDSDTDTPMSRWAHDGLTQFADRGQWSRVTVRVSAADLVAGDAYTLRLRLTQLPVVIGAVDTWAFGVFATCGQGARVVASVTET